jgi:hypothetical protein
VSPFQQCAVDLVPIRQSAKSKVHSKALYYDRVTFGSVMILGTEIGYLLKGGGAPVPNVCSGKFPTLSLANLNYSSLTCLTRYGLAAADDVELNRRVGSLTRCVKATLPCP